MNKYLLTSLYIFVLVFSFSLAIQNVSAQSCVTGSDCSYDPTECTSTGGGGYSVSCSGGSSVEINDGGGICHMRTSCPGGTQTFQGTYASGSVCNNGLCQRQNNGGMCQETFEWGSYTIDGESYPCGSGGGGGGSCNNNGICDAGETVLSCPSDNCDPPPNFTISVSPATHSGLNGEMKTYNVTVTPNNSSAAGDYTFAYPIPGCPVGATCEYSGGDNTASTGTDTNVNGDEIVTPAFRQVFVTPTSTIAGTYPLTFSATKTGTSGTVSTSASLIVNQGVNNSSCTSISVPASVAAGSTFNTTVVMYNNGTTAWSPNDMRSDIAGINNYHVLVSPWSGGTGTWATSRAPISTNVVPGGSISVTIPVTAPSTPGTYNYSTQMLQEGVQWFGAVCNGGNIVVVANAPTATISPSATSVIAGQTVNFTVTGTSNSGLHSIGLESSTAGGTATANLGIFYSSANSATNVFPWTSSTPGTYYFMGYAWSSGLAALTRTAPVAITVNPAPVNGSCSATHYNCNAGTSVNNAENSPNWTWMCNGLNGGTNVSCSEPIPPPTNFVASCPSPGTTASFSWNLPSGYPLSYFRVVDNTAGGSNPGYWIPENRSDTGPSTSFTSIAGHNYSAWIHTRLPSGAYSSSMGSTFTCTAPPNLTAGAPTPSSATTNVAQTFTSTITNNGTGSTGASFSNFFQVATAANGGGTITDLTSSSMSTLGSGASGTATSPAYTFTSTGTYSVRACADKSNSASAGTITESNEGDNCGGWTNVTVSNAPQASFTISPTTMSFSAVTGAAAPNAQTLTTTNTGTAQLNYTATSNQGWCYINGVTSLGPVGVAVTTGSPVSISVNDPDLMGPATFTCTITISDPAAATPTSRTLTVTYTVTNPVTPNLTAGAPTPSSATTNVAQTFTSTITNNGTGSTGASFSNFFQVATAANGGGTITDLTSSSMSTLGSGASGTATSPAYTFTSTGTYSVRACADKSNSASAGTITESNEGDNCGGWTNVTVSSGAGPTACPSGSAYVSSKVLGTLRNDYSGWVGTRILIGSSDRTVTALGRIRVAGNSGTHTVKLVYQSNGADVPGGSVSINMSSGTAGEYVYGTLASPLTLTANTSYYVVSQEVNGGDQWHNDTDTQVFPGSVGTILGAIYGTTGAWNFNGTANRSYVPVDLCTTAAVAPISITSFNPYFTSITDYPTTNNNTVYWTTSGNPTSCVATGSNPWGNGAGTAAVNASIASGNHYQGVYPSVGTYTYTLTCSKAGVSDAVAAFSVSVTAAGPTTYNLTVSKPIGGSVVSVDSFISCGATCVRQYNQGSSVTLQPIPDTAYWRFVGWGGACSGQGTGNCTITINADTSVTAQFRPKSLLYQEF